MLVLPFVPTTTTWRVDVADRRGVAQPLHRREVGPRPPLRVAARQRVELALGVGAHAVPATMCRQARDR